MSILQKPADHTKQNFVINGVKFFKHHLDLLRLDSSVTDTPITTSEISLFMILHLYTDEMGQIRSFTKDAAVGERKQLCISHLAKEHDLTYETVKKAFDRLIERKYISEVFTAEGMHYEIVNYAQLNQQTTNPDEHEDLNYFRIPHVLFEERLFGELIRKRYHKGPILLLELTQYFTRQIGTNRKSVEDVKKVTGVRKMDFLKKSLQTTAKRVREFLAIIRPVFQFDAIDTKLKQPNSSRLNRVREFVQVCIEKFSFSLNKNCYIENHDLEGKQVLAATKKEMAARIKHAQIPIKWRDMIDIQKSILRIVKQSKHFDVIHKTRDLIAYTTSTVADILEEKKRDGTFSHIKSVGAFVNKLFANSLKDYQQHQLTAEERIEVTTAYWQTYQEHPPFMTA